jgi:ABC-type Zn uptake system ZnuABC Zn-binding protein ZnuA
MRRIGVLVVLLAVAATVLPPMSVHAARKLRVVATIPDLKSLTEAVGGDLVEVDSLTRGTQNFHEAEVRPSMMLKLRRADAVIENGLGLDAWADVAIAGSNNAELTSIRRATRTSRWIPGSPPPSRRTSSTAWPASPPNIGPPSRRIGTTSSRSSRGAWRSGRRQWRP